MREHHRKTLIHGVGINDADQKVTLRYARKIKSYQVWSGILARCYSPTYQANHPTYVGCTVHPDWHRFSAFKDWMDQQDWQGKFIDKDVLVQGNTVYGPDTCLFVTRLINNFFRFQFSNFELPLGVTRSATPNKFLVSCCNPFTKKQESLGTFTCPNAAHAAWRQRKHEFACQLAETQSDPRVAKALRERFAPLN